MKRIELVADFVVHLGRQMPLEHYRDAAWLKEAEAVYALARRLFPNNRRLQAAK